MSEPSPAPDARPPADERATPVFHIDAGGRVAIENFGPDVLALALALAPDDPALAAIAARLRKTRSP